MTERFTLTNPKNAFQEMKCGIDDWGKTLTFNEVVDMLNQLNDENEQLKQTVSDWSGSYDELFEDVKRLEEENEQLKQQLTDVDRLIDCKIVEYQKYDGYDTEKYYIGTQLLKELKKEFER